jgi:replication-associated recombination protein RarA
MVLWGHRGVGKTTLARLIADRVHSEFVALSAVTKESADVQAATEEAAPHGARQT